MCASTKGTWAEHDRGYVDIPVTARSPTCSSPCRCEIRAVRRLGQWDPDRDAEPLLTEALLVPAPVDEMVHAVLAQFTVMSRMQDDLELVFPHATELERFDYTRGCLTDTYYAAAGWGEQPLRYWLDTAEVERRLAILNAHYERAGIGQDGRSHNLDFDMLVTVS